MSIKIHSEEIESLAEKLVRRSLEMADQQTKEQVKVGEPRMIVKEIHLIMNPGVGREQ